MMKANAISVGENRKHSPRGRSLKRLPLRLRLQTELSFFDDIIEDEEKAALIDRLQRERYEATVQYWEEHKNDRKWWE